MSEDNTLRFQQLLNIKTIEIRDKFIVYNSMLNNMLEEVNFDIFKDKLISKTLERDAIILLHDIPKIFEDKDGDRVGKLVIDEQVLDQFYYLTDYIEKEYCSRFQVHNPGTDLHIVLDRSTSIKGIGDNSVKLNPMILSNFLGNRLILTYINKRLLAESGLWIKSITALPHDINEYEKKEDTTKLHFDFQIGYNKNVIGLSRSCKKTSKRCKNQSDVDFQNLEEIGKALHLIKTENIFDDFDYSNKATGIINTINGNHKRYFYDKDPNKMIGRLEYLDYTAFPEIVKILNHKFLNLNLTVEKYKDLIRLCLESIYKFYKDNDFSIQIIPVNELEQRVYDWIFNDLSTLDYICIKLHYDHNIKIKDIVRSTCLNIKEGYHTYCVRYNFERSETFFRL